MDFNFQEAWQQSYDAVVGFVPELVGALLLLLIGYVVAKIIETVVGRLLSAAKFDAALNKSPAGSMIKRVFDSPTSFTARLSFWLVFLGGVSLAISALDIEALNSFMGAIYAYLPHIIAAVTIFLVASAASAAAVSLITRVLGRSPLARTASTVAPSLIMSIAVFMILNELMIAPEIVLITYTAIIGAVALGLALAFGLGGRDVAGRLLEQAVEAGKKTAERAKSDARKRK
jgi:hypothetical protein